MSSRDKLRSLFLSLIMITSVFAGTVAISGTAAANASNAAIGGYAGNSPTTVGDPVGVNVTVTSTTGETVTIKNIVDGDTVNQFQVTDGGSGDEGGSDGTAEGTINATIQAAKQAGGGQSTVEVTGPNGNTESAVYTTGTYDVQVTDEVTHGETTTIQGEIFEYPGKLEDDKVRYSLQFDPALDNDGSSNTVLSDSNTSNGEFQATKTFNIVNDSAPNFLNDYPQDDADLSTAQPGYAVFVNSTDVTVTPGDGDNDGFDIINTRLNVAGSPDRNPVYDETFNFINGNVANETTALDSYQIAFNDPSGSTGQSVTTANNGDFSFTVVPNDGGDWELGTDEGAFINYRNVTVDAQETQLSIDDNGSQINFPTRYEIQLNTSQAAGDNPIYTDASNIRGALNISGPFAETGTGGITVEAGSVSSVSVSSGSGTHLVAETNANGNLTFVATPLTANQDVALVGADGSVANQFNRSNPGLEVTDDADDTGSSSDYIGSASTAITAAEPVNIVDLQVEDEGFENSANAQPPFRYDTIFNDNPSGEPTELEVLPLANGSGTPPASDRVVNGFRVGNDTNRGLSEVATYNVTFTLVNQSSQAITPGGSTASGQNLSSLRLEGAGINATVNSPGSGLAGTGENLVSITHTGSGQYEAVVRPVRVTDTTETFDITVDVDNRASVSTGDVNQADSVETSGLFAERFEVNDNVVEEVGANQTVDLSAQIKNDGSSPTFVNNGRVNVTQRQNVSAPAGEVQVIQLNSTDARTSSVNNGEYDFSQVNIGPRGLETDGDGIGDDVSQLVFTAYQYQDVDSDNALERAEVNNATVETLPLKLNRNIQVEFLNATTVTGSDELAGNDSDGTFTLTQGVEYENITLKLVRDDGTPVNLTNSPAEFGTNPNLNDLETTPSPDLGGNMVHIRDSAGSRVPVELDGAASDNSSGIYTIDDIAGGASGVSSSNAPVQAGDTFVVSDDVADSTVSLRFVAQTPGLSNATATDTGSFVADQAQLETEIFGVSGPNVPNSGGSHTTLAHNQADNLNTNVSDIETPTIDIDRNYRINATVRDALNNTRLNGSAFSEVVVAIAEDDLQDAGDGSAGQEANVTTVAGPGVNTIATAGGPIAPDSAADRAVEITNPNGTFQFDIEVSSDGSDLNGEFQPYFYAAAQADTTLNGGGAGSSPSGTSNASTSPVAQNAVVNVFGDNGGDLPVSSDDDQILANNVRNDLRLEAFPADTDGFVLPNRTTFSLNGTFSESNIEPSTRLNSSVNESLATPGFSEGQIAFFQTTPTASGQEVINLIQGGAIVRGLNGEEVNFDVLRSNREVNITVESATPATAGDSVTVRLTEAGSPDALENTEIGLADPGGTNVDTAITGSDGRATLSVPSSAPTGTFTLDTRPAGFAPETQDLQVAGAADLTIVDGSLNAPSSGQVGTNITVSAVVENTGSVNTTQTVEFRFDRNNDSVLAGGEVEQSPSVTVAAGSTQTVTFSQIQLPSTAGTFEHGVFTPVDNATAQIDVQRAVSNFTVSNLQAPATAVAGDTIDVNATVTNVGSTAGTQTVEFRINGSTADSQSVQLSSGQNTTVSFSVPTSGLAPGTFTHGIFTNDDNATAQIQLLQPPTFQGSNLQTPANVTVGDQLNATVDVTNTGNVTGNTSLSFTLNGTNVSRSGGSGAVDVVFALDSSGSMSDENSEVRQAIQNFTATLQQQGLDVRYAVVQFGQTRDLTIIQNYTSDVTQTRNSVSTVINNGGATEFNYEALNGSIDQLSERSNANEVFIDITDEDTENNPRISQSALSQRLENEDIQYIAVAPNSTSPLEKKTLANITTGASYFDIATGNIGGKLTGAIATQIINQTGGGQQVQVQAGATETVSLNISTSQLAPGNYTLEVTVGNTTLTQQLALESGNPFQGSVPGTGGQAPPADTDGDGLFEDVDGDGTADFDDAVALSFVNAGQLTADQVDALDFDGDGDVDFDDAVDLSFAV